MRNIGKVFRIRQCDPLHHPQVLRSRTQSWVSRAGPEALEGMRALSDGAEPSKVCFAGLRHCNYNAWIRKLQPRILVRGGCAVELSLLKPSETQREDVHRRTTPQLSKATDFARFGETRRSKMTRTLSCASATFAAPDPNFRRLLAKEKRYRQLIPLMLLCGSLFFNSVGGFLISFVASKASQHNQV